MRNLLKINKFKIGAVGCKIFVKTVSGAAVFRQRVDTVKKKHYLDGPNRMIKERITVLVYTLVTPRQPTRQTTINAVEINKREYGVNTCSGTTCHGSN